MPRFALVLCLSVTLLPSVGQAQNSLDEIKQTRTLKWGADPSGGAPFVYVDPDNADNVIGFEVDLVEALTKHLAKRLGLETLKPELVRADWASLPEAMRAGRCHVILNGLEMTAERAKKVSFSTPYYVYEQQLTVRSADANRYRTLADLKGKKVAVLKSSASVKVLLDAGWDKDNILEYEDSLTPYDEVKLERADAALAESIIAAHYVGLDEKLHNVPQTFNTGTYALAVRPEDTALLEHINAALEEMKRNGELAAIYVKWNIWSSRQELIGVYRTAKEAETVAGERTSVWWALLKGAGVTLLLTAGAMPLALAFGLALALMARSPNVLLRFPAQVYIQVIRGTPLLVQVFLIYYTLPQLATLLGLPPGTFTLGRFVGPEAEKIVVGIFCLAANYAAYEAEIHRAGIDAVPRGQREAALSLGMSERQAFTSVVLPQSFRIILPPVLNDLISMLKDSSIVYVIGAPELLNVAMRIGRSQFN